MKKVTNNLKLLGIATLTCAVLAVSCSKSRRATRKTVGVELKELPCEDQTKSTKKYFRAHGMGESQNLTTAKQKALLNAKQTVASLINSTLKSVTDNYINERTFGDDSEFEAKFENMTREVVKQKLSDIEVICQKNTTMKDGTYKSFYAIQIDKDAIVNNIHNGISRDAKLQIDYDKMKFEQKFNEEMEKLEQQSGY
jgi:hypothetical protein